MPVNTSPVEQPASVLSGAEFPDETETLTISDHENALQMAEGLFEDRMLLGYYTIKAFLDLYAMVAPENRKRLAQILEGIVK